MKRFVTAIMVIALIAPAVFAGGTAEGTTGTAAAFNETGFPIVDEPITLTMAAGKHPLSGDIVQFDLWKQYEEMTNVRIEADFVPAASWAERRNLLLASADLPDILGNVPPADIVRYSAQGLFLPMNDLIAQYAPYVRQLFETRPGIERALRLPDGEIYSLPRVNEFRFREVPDMMYINKAWLDRVGLPIPTTTAELETALRAFRDNDVNLSGDPNDEIPMSFMFTDELSLEPWSLLGMFGTLDNAQHRIVMDGEVIFTPFMPEYREGMKWFARMYAEGLIDPEVFTHSRREYAAKGTGGDYAVYGLAFEWFVDSVVGTERGEAEYVTLPPLEGPDGHQLWHRVEDSYFAGKGWFLMGYDNENPEVTMRWFDYIYEPDFSLQWSRGPWDVGLDRRDDGTIVFREPPAGMSYNEFRFSISPGGATGWSVLNDMYDQIDLDPSSTKKLHEDWPMYQPYLIEEAYPDLFFTLEESERLATLTADIQNYVQQMKARWIIGELDIDATWAEFEQTLRRMGVEEYVQIQQTALDRHMGRD